MARSRSTRKVKDKAGNINSWILVRI